MDTNSHEYAADIPHVVYGASNLLFAVWDGGNIMFEHPSDYPLTSLRILVPGLLSLGIIVETFFN